MDKGMCDDFDRGALGEANAGTEATGPPAPVLFVVPRARLLRLQLNDQLAKRRN